MRLADVELLDYRHELDLSAAMMKRIVRFRDGVGRETTLRSRRFVSMAHSNLAGIEWTLIAENWSGPLEVISAIDGRFAHGKPDPEMFLTAANELSVPPERVIVMEDASAGAQAAKAGEMGAIGIGRNDDAELLAAAGADIVVRSLDEVDLSALAAGRLAIAAATAQRAGRPISEL